MPRRIAAAVIAVLAPVAFAPASVAIPALHPAPGPHVAHQAAPHAAPLPATASSAQAPAKPAEDTTRTPGKAKYTADLTSDTSGSHWTGHQKIDFTNTGADPLPFIYLRLWDNGLSGCESTNPIRVTNLTGGTAGDLEVNCTAMKVTFASPLAGGASASVAFDLAVDVPSNDNRFGKDGAYNYLGNVLPVLAIHDAKDWHLDPYTNGGESFYTLVSDFDVTLTHPKELLTPSTGTPTETDGPNGTVVTKAVASQVRDFAWAAGPFHSSSTTSQSGVKVNTYWVDQVDDQTGNSVQDTGAQAIDQHAQRFGAYPYGQVDMVLDNNFWFGGMEYPGFVLDKADATVVHELAHQYWYGIVGDDEYNDPWLDEAFTTYSTDLFNNQDGAGCWDQVQWQADDEKITNGMGYWDANNRGQRYFTVVYGYGSCALHELGRLIGEDKMATLLRDYAKAHWFGVSTDAEFKAAAQAAAGSTDLSTFWTDHRIDG
jgi:hypothetical protein